MEPKNGMILLDLKSAKQRDQSDNLMVADAAKLSCLVIITSCSEYSKLLQWIDRWKHFKFNMPGRLSSSSVLYVSESTVDLRKEYQSINFSE